jgi:hypothetical protein
MHLVAAVVIRFTTPPKNQNDDSQSENKQHDCINDMLVYTDGT